MIEPLTPKQLTTASKIAGLTIVNAMVFQEVLAGHDARVESLHKTLSSADPVGALATHWKFILDSIDYYPIFHVSRDLLLTLPANKDIASAVGFLGGRALSIVGRRAALRHDLMGRVYHRLLEDAKYLGTYYTSVPAATLLLKLALPQGVWSIDWSDLGQIDALRIADLACGTGTLLMAAAEAVTDNYVGACAAKGIPPDIQKLHQLLMQDVIYGYDVLPSALHLTASTLALRASSVSFTDTNLYSIPLGGPKRRMGSIEFLDAPMPRQIPGILDLFATPAQPGQVTGTGHKVAHSAPLPDLDLCVMNPPFTRSVGGNRLFGSLPKNQITKMQTKLKELVAKNHTQASITAGLGSVFVAIGDQALKENGRMALVLPKTLLSGVSWHLTRQLLAQRYQLEYLVVSHDPDHWNFSDNTELSEVLVVARRLRGGESHDTGEVQCLNLWQNPKTAVEALSVAHSVMGQTPPGVTGQGALSLQIAGRKAGEAISVPWAILRNDLWMLPCAFAQSDLIRASAHLLGRKVYVPGRLEVTDIALAPLGTLGDLGPDRRDIHDGFDIASGKTTYPAYMGHDADLVTTLAQQPNAYLTPLAKAKKGRPLRKVTDLWPKAGNLLIAERMWLYTQRLTAIRVDEPVLANVWWPFAFHKNDADSQKILAMWFNGTLGQLLLLAYREETRGAWIAFKKPVLEALPVLDPHSLTPAQRDALAKCFDRISAEKFLPLRSLGRDPLREQIDEAFSAALGLPDISPLRQLLAQEPMMTLQRLT